MKRSFLPVGTVILFCLLSSPIRLLSAQEISEESFQFSANNPDGQKYEFVKTYMMALEYIYQNELAEESAAPIDQEGLKNVQRLSNEKNRLAMANVNLRIARNLIEKFDKSRNGLVLRVIELFSQYVNEQASLNNQERLLVTIMYESALNNKVGRLKQRWYKDSATKIIDQRKKTSLNLLEASMLISKVLISHQFNQLGEFNKLGITREERQKLLSRLKVFDGDEFQGDPRAGQTFLQASVTSIRQILEDSNWAALDNSI